MSGVAFKDHSSEVLGGAASVKDRALEAIGLKAEGYAKKNTPVDTGRLRNSITHAVDGGTAVIGTNVEYGKYIELGTGVYASEGGGRQTPWMYKDDKGVWHKTRGNRAFHMLSKAVTEHRETYKALVKKLYKGD